MKVKALLITILFSHVLLLSCGLNTFYAINPPINAQRINQADGTILEVLAQPNDQVFIFFARDLTALPFLSSGTEVYYRIYSSQEDLQNDASRINDANDDDTNNGWKELENLQYKKIRGDGSSVRLIDAAGGNVRIRLSDTDIEPAFIQPSSQIPRRDNNEFFHFDKTLNIGDSDYELVQDGDSDYESSGDEGFWYVNAYAVSMGMDSSTFQEVQSEVLSLGFTAYSRD